MLHRFVLSSSSVILNYLYCVLFQISMDQGHMELVKQYGSALAETIGGLVHTARYRYCVVIIHVKFHACIQYIQNLSGGKS